MGSSRIPIGMCAADVDRAARRDPSRGGDAAGSGAPRRGSDRALQLLLLVGEAGILAGVPSVGRRSPPRHSGCRRTAATPTTACCCCLAPSPTPWPAPTPNWAPTTWRPSNSSPSRSRWPAWPGWPGVWATITWPGDCGAGRRPAAPSGGGRNLRPARRRRLGRACPRRAAGCRRGHPAAGTDQAGRPDPTGTAHRRGRQRGRLQPPDRRPALPQPSNGRLPPAQGVPEDRDHLTRRARPARPRRTRHLTDDAPASIPFAQLSASPSCRTKARWRSSDPTARSTSTSPPAPSRVRGRRRPRGAPSCGPRDRPMPGWDAGRGGAGAGR
jgi:hypothetical protein